jgi:predicted phage replisome organizer
MNEVFWVRMFCAEFDDPRWLAIEQLPDADAVQMIYVRMLMLAGRSNAGGLLLLHESLPYDVTTLSAVLRRTTPVVQFALATLERFKFIEVVDNVIAITAWDRLQPTNELARIAVRRDKDKLRKRTQREKTRSQLQLSSKDASADNSADSPRKSRPTKTKIYLELDKTTTQQDLVEDVVAFERGKLDEAVGLIPQSEKNKRLMSLITEAVSRIGEAVTISNIRYALANHDPGKGRLGGMICAALEHDFASSEREAVNAAAETQTAARIRRVSVESARKEQEERERREALTQQAIWLSLSAEDRTVLAQQAQKKYPCLPEPTSPLETVLDDPAVPITKILAAMYARGELSIPLGVE